MAVDASASPHQLSFRCTSFGQIEEAHITAATAGNRGQAAKPNTQFGETTFIERSGNITHQGWIFQGLPNTCLMFRHIITSENFCAEHLMPTKDLFS